MRVVLLTGPAGSGKSSTAARIAEHPGWVHLSEDDYWIRIKQGRPPGELRTPEEQDVVHPQVLRRLFDVLSHQKSVVLEFILYEDPPRPLLRYQDELVAENVPFITRILRPDADEILRRIHTRARSSESDRARLRVYAERQVRVLESVHIQDEWVLDTTALTLEEVYERHFKPIVDP